MLLGFELLNNKIDIFLANKYPIIPSHVVKVSLVEEKPLKSNHFDCSNGKLLRREKIRVHERLKQFTTPKWNITIRP